MPKKKEDNSASTRLLPAETPPWAEGDDDHDPNETHIVASEGYELTSTGLSDDENDDLELSRPVERDVATEETAMQLTRGQKVAWTVSHALAVAAMVIVSIWISDEAMGGGGLSWKEGEPDKIFNWHPLMMISAFVFMTVASLSFRSPCVVKNRKRKKLTHGLAWTLAAVSVAVGITAVVKSHNDPVGGYIANLYSLHSWIAIAVMILYTLQFLIGLNFFALNLTCISPSFRAAVLSLHSFYGPFIYFATATTILLGIQENDGFMECWYDVDQPDTQPYKHFYDIPYSCKLSHSLGLIVFIMALSTGYAIYKFPKIQTNNENI